MKKGYLLYAGQRLVGTKIYCEYFILDDLVFDENTTTSNCKKWTTYDKIWKNGIGAIQEVTFKDDETISYSKNSFPVAFWKNTKERSEWEAKQAIVKQYNSLKKEGLEDKIKEVLEPLRFLYQNATMREREAIIAKIISTII